MRIPNRGQKGAEMGGEGRGGEGGAMLRGESGRWWCPAKATRGEGGLGIRGFFLPPLPPVVRVSREPNQAQRAGGGGPSRFLASLVSFFILIRRH